MSLKIGILNDSFPPTIDGVANTAYHYARVIQQNHGDAVAVTPKYPGVRDNCPFEVYRYPSVPMPKRVGYRAGNSFSPTTVSNLVNMRFDLLHVHAPFSSSLLASQIQSKVNIPIVFTYHTKFDVDIDKRAPKPANVVMKQLVKSNLHAANEVWVVSRGAVESLRHMGYNGPFKVMENGTDFRRDRAADAAVAEIDRTYRLQSGEWVFLFVGRMMWYKNVRLALDALKILKDGGLPFRMFFAGGGIDLPEITQYAASLGLQNNAVFLGPVSDREKLRAFFSRANLFIFPSTYDTSGLVVKEAAACSLPSVLVRGSCAAEGVSDGVTGFLCGENAPDCARAVLQAVGNSDALRKIGRNACEQIYLSWDDAVAKAYKRYEEIVTGWPYEY